MYELSSFAGMKKACTRHNAYTLNCFFVKLNTLIVTAFD